MLQKWYLNNQEDSSSLGDAEGMMPGMSMTAQLPSGPDFAKKAMPALMSTCECEACKILRNAHSAGKTDRPCVYES